MLKFLYTLIFIILLIGLIVFGLVWFNQDNGGPEIEFNGPEQVWIGTPFELEVQIANGSDQIFQDAKISLSLPEGMVFVGESPDEMLISRKIGNLGVGSLTNESFKLMVVASELPRIDIKESVTASIDYSPEFLGSRFKKDEPWEFEIVGSAIELNIEAPEKIVSGETLRLVVSYENNSGANLRDLVLAVEYPPTFQYDNATIKPDTNNNEWQLGGLRAGSENEFTIIGKLIGQENGFFNFKFNMQSRLEDQLYIINYQPLDLTIGTAPLSLRVTANNVEDYVAKLDDDLKYVIDYRYLKKPIADQATITAKLTGQMFDFKSASVGVDSQNIISWSLGELSQSGLVEFTIKTKDDFDIKRLGDRNFVLAVEVAMDDGQYVSAAKVENKVTGKAAVEAQAFFRDADSGIINEGPFPPMVGQPTNYTIHWPIINYATDIKDVVIKAKLASNVVFTGVSKSNGATEPEYNSDTNEVVWRAGRISATKGAVGAPLEAIFQIEALPPSGTEGEYMTLLEKTRLTATDEFTGFTLSYTDDPITTELPDDKTVSDGKVTATE
ncbi:MAG: hypothetical protein ABH822_01550 [Patescibacteria group bacterium]